MAVNRANTFPAVIHDYLSEHDAAYATLPTELKLASCLLLASCGHQRRRFPHQMYDGAITMSYRVRNDLFGDRSTFYATMHQLGYIHVIERWQSPAANQAGFTKGYQLSEKGRAVINAVRGLRGTLMDTNGNRLRKPAQYAIQSRDAAGKSRRGVGNLPASARVNEAEVERLRLELLDWRWTILNRTPSPEHHTPALLARLSEMSEPEALDWLNRAIQQIGIHLTYMRLDYLPRSHVETLYIEYSTGRLFAQGISLQGAVREIRHAAFRLPGHFEYDLSNAHFSIIWQLATRVGRDMPKVQRYLERKREIRASIANEVGITVADTKACLLSIVYGAKRQTQAYLQNGRWKQSAIPDLIGVEAAKRLYAHPEWNGLIEEVRGVKKPILASMPQHQGRVINALGKQVEAGADPLSHVIQGVESCCLHAIIQEFGPDLVLLQHDGWTSRCRLDVEAMQALILDRTGFKVSIEEMALC